MKKCPKCGSEDSHKVKVAKDEYAWECYKCGEVFD